ncbi:MAG: LemA family protein [Clostridia bacterium]|nr:LemA family protein [Clostridia bacterium]
MPWIIVLVVVVVIAIYVVGIYNSLVTMRNKIEETYATVEAYLKKRYDLIPNLVETVKGYAKHENQTLTAVIEARNMAMSAKGFEEQKQGENQLQQTLKTLFAVAESYPDLKANTNFMDLQAQLLKVEEDILQARKYYNAVVKTFNTKVELFPSSIVAKMFSFKKREYWEIEDAAHENVQVKF